MPTYKMPDERDRLRATAVAGVHNALLAARCSIELAGMETEEFLVRELLLAAIREIDLAAEQLRRFRAPV